MGIKGLWTVLTPFSEKKSLHEIRGETIAVDLAGWVCDSQNVTDYYIQPKLYLRNLFFRTIYLLLADVDPIFVLEGDAPELKRDVMAARNAIQFRGAPPRSEEASKKRPDVGRKRFRNVLKECETLLKSMGVRCIKGKGEAEATCAQLNAQVDAVVSQDSDCFAYGARRVYRNFSVSSSAGAGAMQGSIDCYDAEKMFQNNGFGRNKMVGLALLCGCDYVVGACGSSITTVLSFLHSVPDRDIIPRLVSWVSDPEYYAERTRWSSAPGRCDRCGHVGRTHAKNGCPVCASHRGCVDHGHKSKVTAVKRELSLRNKALSCGTPFPEPKVMKEFLDEAPDEIDVSSLKKPTPSLVQFVLAWWKAATVAYITNATQVEMWSQDCVVSLRSKMLNPNIVLSSDIQEQTFSIIEYNDNLMSSKLDWSERYSVQKFLPLLTKWHLQDNVPQRTIKPVKIKKKRNPKGVPSFEVQWTDIDGQYEDLISDDQFQDGEDKTLVWTSTERQDLLRHYYPNIVEAYEESIKKPAKEKKSRGRKKKDGVDNEKPKRKYKKKANKSTQEVTNLSGSVSNRDLPNKTSELNTSKVHVKVVKLKRKLKQSTSKGQRTIHSFIANKKRKSSKEIDLMRCSFRNMSINNDEYEKVNHSECDHGNKENMKPSNHLLSMFKSSCDLSEDFDLSGIVDVIVTRAPLVKTARLDRNLVKLVFDKHSTPRKSTSRKSTLMDLHYNCSTPRGSPLREPSLKLNRDDSGGRLNVKVNTSYFFDKLSEDRDAFELSLEYEHRSGAVYDVSDKTSDLSLPHVHL